MPISETLATHATPHSNRTGARHRSAPHAQRRQPPENLDRPCPPKRPSKWRQTLLTLLVVYPFITGLLYLVIPLAMRAGWQIWQITLVVAPVMVFTLSYAIVPLVMRYCGRYIFVPAK